MLPEKKKELMRPVVETVNKLPEDGQKVFEIAAMAYLLGREQGKAKELPRCTAAAAR